MDWSDLRYFRAAATTGQLARAAVQLGTDPTTVGRRIRRLEAALGERLLEQRASGQTLTAAGVRLLDQVDAMARIVESIDTPSAEGAHGSINVSVSEGFGTWLIARHLAEFADAHPNLTVELVATSGFLNPTRRETDLAVLLARPRKGPLITRKLTNYRLGVYACARGGGYSGTSDRELEHARWVGYIPNIIYAPELLYMDELPFKAEAVLRSSSINAQHGLIASGAGIGILPCFIGDSDPSIVRIRPDIEIMRTFWLATHRETHRFHQVRLFSDWLLDLTRRKRDLLLGSAAES